MSTDDTEPLPPLEWATVNATIVHPARGRIPFVPYPYQARFLEMHDVPRRLILKARQIGFSQVFALEALYRAITRDETTILMVSRTGRLAVELLKYCYRTYSGLVDPMPLTKQNESEMGFTNGSRIISVPADRSTGRGFAASHVYLDEFAYADYAESIYQSISPTVSQGGTITIGSTPNGEENLFAKLYKDDPHFEKMNVPWWQCPGYWTPHERDLGIPKEHAAWYQKEHPHYTPQAWASEYDCDFSMSTPDRFLPSMLWWDACALAEMPALDHRTPMVLALDAGVTGDNFGIVGVSRVDVRPDALIVRYVRAYEPKGVPLDFDTIEYDVRQLCRTYNIVQIAYDPYQLHQMMTRLTNDNIAWCEPFGQGEPRLIADKQLLDLIMRRDLFHDGDALLRAHIDHADRKTGGEQREKLRLVKRSESLKIDLAVCLSMACARMLEQPTGWTEDQIKRAFTRGSGV